VEDTWDKIFVGGLPCNYADEQVCYVTTPYVTPLVISIDDALPVCWVAAHLPRCKTVVENTWGKIFVGGLPCNYADEQVCYSVTNVVTWFEPSRLKVCASAHVQDGGGRYVGQDIRGGPALQLRRQAGMFCYNMKVTGIVISMLRWVVSVWGCDTPAHMQDGRKRYLGQDIRRRPAMQLRRRAGVLFSYKCCYLV
jgi:hypothetical protein